MARRALPLPLPATWLRVYEPLDAFGQPSRRAWAAYVAEPGAGSRAEAVERMITWRRLLPEPTAVRRRGAAAAAGPVGASRRAPGEARVLLVDGAPFLCPVPSGRRALVRAWDLPIAWCTLFARAGPGAGIGPGADASFGYRVAPMARCRTQAARALRSLRRAFGEMDLTADLARAAQWLEGFHPRSWVEFDARCVAALVDDDGVDDVRLGLDALARGDAGGVVVAYRRLAHRRELLAALARAS